MIFQTLKRGLIILTIAIFAITATARSVTQEEAHRAAEILLTDPLFQATFPMSTICAVDPVGELWCVKLSPQGYMMLSGSTKVDPLLAYGKRYYTPPPKAHPASVIQTHHQTLVREQELLAPQLLSLTEEKSAAERAWEQLLNPSPLSLRTATYTQTLGPLLQTTWNQCEPWNDLVPQHEAEASPSSYGYNGRMPLGCVATMYSQIMNYHQWPACFNESPTQTLTATDGLLAEYEMRFHGGEPIDWTALKPSYSLNETETTRLPIARLGLLTDILSEVNFAPEGTGAILEAPCENPWYDFGECIDDDINLSSTKQLNAILASLKNGCPIPTSIPGHAIIVDGYAKDASSNVYLHVNYGWGGINDNTLLAKDIGINSYVLNHKPRQQVNIEPLPKQIKNGHLLTWHVPKYWENTFTGFTVKATPFNTTTLTTWSDPATTITDPMANTTVFSTTTTPYNNTNIPVYNVALDNVGLTYTTTLQPYLIPTATSTFTCVSKADHTLNHTLEVQIRSETSPTWETLTTLPSADKRSGNWATTTVSLSKYAGQICNLRLCFDFLEEGDGSYYTGCNYKIGEIKLTDVYATSTTEEKTWTANSTVRQQTLNGLTTGRRYMLSIQPTVTSGKTETTTLFTTTTTEISPIPAIQSVTATTTANLNGPRLNGALEGKSIFRVVCNDAVTHLYAQSSCPTLIPDENIQIYRYDKHTFDVVITSNLTSPAFDGSRIIITFEACNAQDNKAYSNAVLALRSVTATTPYTPPEVVMLIEGKTLVIPHYWFRSTNLATTSTPATNYSTLAQQDADNDGQLTWKEYLCGTHPNDATDKLRITHLEFNADGTLKQVHFAPHSAALVDFVLEGKIMLSDATWSPYNMQTHRFFRVRAEMK